MSTEQTSINKYNAPFPEDYAGSSGSPSSGSSMARESAYHIPHSVQGVSSRLAGDPRLAAHHLSATTLRTAHFLPRHPPSRTCIAGKGRRDRTDATNISPLEKKKASYVSRPRNLNRASPAVT